MAPIGLVLHTGSIRAVLHSWSEPSLGMAAPGRKGRSASERPFSKHETGAGHFGRPPAVIDHGPSDEADLAIIAAFCKRIAARNRGNRFDSKKLGPASTEIESSCSQRIPTSRHHGDPLMQDGTNKLQKWALQLFVRTQGCREAYLIGGGLVQVSWASASLHREPMGIMDIQVSTSLPPSVR